ncbi:MAG: hypothetical protein JW941_07250 [Candidatus Coatesbacteria bacterium]|nr:hypothetical protein [Candidatus Coatesbacteria bacterium]
MEALKLVGFAVAGLLIGIFLLRSGLKNQSWFLSILGMRGVFLAAIMVVPILLFGAFIFLPIELAVGLVFAVYLGIWILLSHLAFKHKREWVGKALFFLAMVWAALPSYVLVGLLEWDIQNAIMTTTAISALALIIWATVRSQIEAANERRAAFYRSIHRQIDTTPKPPWEE